MALGPNGGLVVAALLALWPALTPSDRQALLRQAQAIVDAQLAQAKAQGATKF